MSVGDSHLTLPHYRHNDSTGAFVQDPTPCNTSWGGDYGELTLPKIQNAESCVTLAGLYWGRGALQVTCRKGSGPGGSDFCPAYSMMNTYYKVIRLLRTHAVIALRLPLALLLCLLSLLAYMYTSFTVEQHNDVTMIVCMIDFKCRITLLQRGGRLTPSKESRITWLWTLL
jgi:hypothetical protein